MAFTPYITYEKYVELGGTVSEDAFPMLEREAQYELDYITFDRIKLLPEIIDEVEFVLVKFIELFSIRNTVLPYTGVTAYSNSTESITLQKDAGTVFKLQLNELAITYLPFYLTNRSVRFNAKKYIQSTNNNP